MGMNGKEIGEEGEGEWEAQFKERISEWIEQEV